MFDQRACTVEISSEVDQTAGNTNPNLGNILWVSKTAPDFFHRKHS